MLASASPPRKVFNTIQILRGLAALIVVLFHLTLGYERRGQPLIFAGIFQHGYAGVDLFFVISGFVIMHTSHRYFGQVAYFGTYLRKRLIRIYPVYWATLLIVLGSIYVMESITHQPLNWLPNTWALFLSTIFLLPNHIEVIGVTWSLSFELYYYLIFGLLILSARSWPVVLLVLLVSAAALIHPTLFPDSKSLLTYCFSPYNLEFAAGVLGWFLVSRFKPATWACIAALAASIIWLLIQPSALFEAVSQRVITYGVSAFLLVVASTGLEQQGWFRPATLTQLFMKIGDASYLIYIVHFPFLPFYGKQLVPLLSGMVWHNLAALACTALLTWVCIGLHYNLEIPLVRKLNLLFGPTPR